MANIVISNNGNEAKPEIQADEENGIEWQAAVDASPSITVTSEDGNIVAIKPGVSVGFELGKYTIEVK